MTHNKRFDANLFRGEKCHELLRHDFSNAELSKLLNTALLVLDKYASRHHKYLGKNNSNSMKKDLIKTSVLGPSKGRR